MFVVVLTNSKQLCLNILKNILMLLTGGLDSWIRWNPHLTVIFERCFLIPGNFLVYKLNQFLFVEKNTSDKRTESEREAVFGSTGVLSDFCLCRERHTFIMLLSETSLVLLMVCATQASHFLGTVMTYYPKDTFADGSVTVRTFSFLK